MTIGLEGQGVCMFGCAKSVTNFCLCYIQPLSTIKAMDTNKNQASLTTVMAQKALLGTELETHVQVRTTTRYS